MNLNLSLLQINLSGQEYSPIAVNLENAIAVDFHYRRDLIYWTDVTIDAILMSYRNGSGKTGRGQVDWWS